jgi:hypothetical protein
MPSHITFDKKAKTKGVERVMMRDAMRQYATSTKQTLVQVRAHAPATKRPKPKSKRKKKA